MSASRISKRVEIKADERRERVDEILVLRDIGQRLGGQLVSLWELPCAACQPRDRAHVFVPAALWIVLVVPSHDAVAIWVTWKALVFPHDWIVSRSAGGSEAIFSGSTAVLVAIGQWAVVAFAFGRLLHARSLRTVAWVAPLTIIAVGVAVLLLIRTVGCTDEADLP